MGQPCSTPYQQHEQQLVASFPSLAEDSEFGWSCASPHVSAGAAVPATVLRTQEFCIDYQHFPRGQPMWLDDIFFAYFRVVSDGNYKSFQKCPNLETFYHRL